MGSETCSSGCSRYSNRSEQRAAYAAFSGHRRAKVLPTPNQRRAARKKQRQNKKAR